MNTQTIQLDISIDIFDRVVKFLKTLPKNKIKLKIEDNIIFKKKVSLQTLQSSSMNKTWNNIEDEAWNEV